MNKIKYVSLLLDNYTNVTPELYNSGVTWYEDANKVVNQLSNEYQINSTIVAKVISSLSPSCSWSQNIKDSKTMLTNFASGKDIDSFKVSTYGKNKIKAWDILNGQKDLTNESPKTFAFYNNLLLCPNHVTIDVWILRLLQFSKEYITPLQYKVVTECFKIASRETNLLPYELQSILWCHIRNKAD